MMRLNNFFVSILSAAFIGASAEHHAITFDNRCGAGTPTLISHGNVISTGGVFTTNGPITALAYLQVGNCGFNEEGCTVVETSLSNPISSTDISLIPPHKFSGPASFSYYNGCDGLGAECNNANCPSAVHTPDGKPVVCPVNDVNLLITFCP